VAEFIKKSGQTMIWKAERVAVVTITYKSHQLLRTMTIKGRQFLAEKIG